MKILELGKTKDKWSIQHRCTGWGNENEGCEGVYFDQLVKLIDGQVG